MKLIGGGKDYLATMNARTCTLVFAFSTACVGCGGESVLPEGQETPEQTVRKGWNAVRTNDFQAMEEVFDAEAPRNLLRQSCTTGHKAWTCRMKITKRFGAEGWQLFSEPSPPGEREVGEFELSVSVAELDEDWIDNLEFSIDRDSATYDDPASELDVQMTRKDGVWRTEFPKGNHKWLMKWFASMEVAMDAALKHVDDRDMTPKKLKKIASKAFVQAQRQD